MNPTIRAHNMIDLMEDLIAVLKRETEMLERPRAENLAPVVEEKQALFKLYNDQLEALSKEGGFGAALPEDLKATLGDLALSFEAAVVQNRRKLEVLTKSSQHIVNRIVEAAKKAAGNVPHYGAKGAVYNGGKAAPVAMNREI